VDGSVVRVHGWLRLPLQEVPECKAGAWWGHGCSAKAWERGTDEKRHGL